MYRDPHQVSANAVRQARQRAADALYVISVAARLVELHPTTLRKYERVGFLEPSRTPGRTRLYSHDDIRRLRQIKHLVEEREMNLAGVQMALDLTEVLSDIATAIDQAQDVAALRHRLQAPLHAAFATLGARE
jgi:MerR family transcriptional regulator/heat shock protein HspR